MYLREIKVKNVRSLTDLTWRLPAEAPRAGWHVLIGDNGAGKSSLLRAVAMVLVGPKEIPALREDWASWLPPGEKQATVRLSLEFDEKVDWWAKTGNIGANPLAVGMHIIRGEQGTAPIPIKIASPAPDRHVWSGKHGWFAVAYGPFRRFRGGDRDMEKLFSASPHLARFLSVFGENVALSECLQWLQQLRFRQLEDKRSQEGTLLNALTAFINGSGLLPHGAQLDEVKSNEVRFRDGNGVPIAVEQLSDGFRSIMSMTFELIRQMTRVFTPAEIFDSADATKIKVPGVVLIDEVDAHLHPSWQHRVGGWFRAHFPRMQFLVTTHSPIICQAADVGSVFRLATPGSAEKSGMLTGVELDRLLYGSVLN